MIDPEPKSLLARLTDFLSSKPEDPIEKRLGLIATLRAARIEGIIDSDALSMIEGVFQVGELDAKDILLPRAQIDWVDIQDPIEKIIADVITTAHSRFPVFEGSRDNVIGILLAKDLLRHSVEKDFEIRDWLRPAVFIPASKRLSVLLKDFRDNRNHLAVVVDEYGGVAGIITIEDVLEQIVGDIEDEHDIDDEADNIVPMADDRYRIRGITSLEQINETFDSVFADEDIDTIAGLVIQKIGRVPKRGDVIEIPPLKFEIQRADPRQIHILIVSKIPLIHQG
ncbi:MAG: transporter associated domain-containing protein [Betaproteobacteria bacterium]|jgi:magnesium and cobalt transporter